MTHQPPRTTAAKARRRNAEDSRQSLLSAAGELFSERGFDRTTTRDIGERAGLDPTLITRYFGNKAGLYLATLRTDFAAEEPGTIRDLLQPERMTELLDRMDRRGPGPIYEAAVRQHADPDLNTEARSVLNERMVDPLERRLVAQFREEPEGTGSASRLRAEIITTAFVGVILSRHSGAFPALAAAPAEQVAGLLAHALQGLCCPD